MKNPYFLVHLQHLFFKDQSFQTPNKRRNKDCRVIFPTPDGALFNHSMAKDFSNNKELTFICGHYKGIDQRIRDSIVTDELSIGDYVLTNGELPALIMIDSIVRLIPGVLNHYESAETDSFFDDLPRSTKIILEKRRTQTKTYGNEDVQKPGLHFSNPA